MQGVRHLHPLFHTLINPASLRRPTRHLRRVALEGPVEP